MSQLSRYRRLLGVSSVLVAAVALTVPSGAAAAEGELMSYVVNIEANAAAMKSAKAAIEDAGGTVIQPWPQIGVVIAHSTSSTFKTDVRKGADGAVIESVGATWRKPAEAAERTAEDEDSMSPLFPGAESRRALAGSVRVAADPREDEQWNMVQIKADVAADGSSDVLVGVMDSGVYQHPDLAPNIDKKNSVDCSGDGSPGRFGVPHQDATEFDDTDFHGTHVAGVIAAARNGEGIVGVAPNVRIASIKIWDRNIPGHWDVTESTICGLIWAVEHDVDVTNSSYRFIKSTYFCDDDEDAVAIKEAVGRAVKYAEHNGVVNVAAAGNKGIDLVNKPKDYGDDCKYLPAEASEATVVVSASEKDERKDGWSSYGYGVIDVIAPGNSVLSTCAPQPGFPPDCYKLATGTSIAAPHAAGVVALLKSAHPKATPKDLTRMLTEQADPHECDNHDENCTGDADYNSHYGYGQVDALEAIGKG